MYNGLLIQNLDIADVSSERRNPILANVMAQSMPLPTHKMSETMTETCRRVNSLSVSRKSSISLKSLRQSPANKMSETLSVSQRTIERDLSALQKHGVLKREGKDNDGVWVIVKNNVN